MGYTKGGRRRILEFQSPYLVPFGIRSSNERGRKTEKLKDGNGGGGAVAVNV